MVKMCNLENGNKWMWTPQEFQERRFRMQALMRSTVKVCLVTATTLAHVHRRRRWPHWRRRAARR